TTGSNPWSAGTGARPQPLACSGATGSCIVWACFGDRAGIDTAAMRRIGHSRTSAAAQLDHPDDELLTVERTLGSDPIGPATADPWAARARRPTRPRA